MGNTAKSPTLSVVLVNYRTADLCIECLTALEAERARVGPFDVIIADGDSQDGSAEKLTEFFADPRWADWVNVLALPINGGFGWANNQAMLRLLQRETPPDYIHLINPDAVPEPGALSALLEVLEAHPRVGAAASQLLEPDGSIAGSAFRFPSPGAEFARALGFTGLGKLIGAGPDVIARSDAGPADWITGASVMFRSAALRETGLFDDGFFLYFEEVELMGRMRRAGWDLWTVPASRVRHIGGASTGVVSGQQQTVRSHPPYRYASRRRYFMRARGAGGLAAANLAWLAGRVLGPPVRIVARRKDWAPPRETGMTLKHGFWPQASDWRPSIPQWDEPPGRPPAWMKD